MRSSDQSTSSSSQTPLYGVLAEFSGVDSLIAACRRVRDAGFTKWDAHTPFPVHGLDGAMGVKPTRLPWFVLLAGLTGLLTALLLQYWTMAVDYQFRISGKPLFSLPAFVPICFELTVLFSAFAAIFGCLGLCKLPNLFSPLFRNARFRRVTNDKFFIFIDGKDKQFDQAKIEALFKEVHAESIEAVFYDEDAPEAQIPRVLVNTVIVLSVVSLVPFVLFARARERTSELPRIHANPPAPIVDDMDHQFKFKSQASNWFFNDNQAMRAWPEGTLAEEDAVVTDTPFLSGKVKDANAWIEKLPDEVALTEQTMLRGQERFGVYCAPCHGLSGYGDGLVARRAASLQEGTWVDPTSLHEARVRAIADGELFNTITHGIRNMPAYGHQIEPADRWAIIMYVRALQLSQHAPKSIVPVDVLPTLK